MTGGARTSACSRDNGDQSRPEGISGRVVRVTSEPTNAIFNLQGSLSEGMLNEFKIGYTARRRRSPGRRRWSTASTSAPWRSTWAAASRTPASPARAAHRASSFPVASSAPIAPPTGAASRTNPWSLAFADVATRITGNHLTKVGVDVRMIRMSTDQLGGTTYTYPNITAFLANQPQSIQYLGDISAPSVFNNGATGMRHTEQTYFVGFAQDEWHATSDLTLNYGLRYDYYTPMKERDNLIVKFNTVTGQIDPNTTPFLISKKNSFQPRLSATYAPGKTVFRAGFGVFVGPGQGEDQIQPIESDRVSTTLSTGPALLYPINQDALVANFTSQPNNRSYAPRAYAPEYQIPEKVYQYTASVQQELGGRFTASAAFVGAEGRDLFLRTITNRITSVYTNPNPANAALIVREFSIVQRDAAGNVTGVQNPYAEVDVKTSGGSSNYKSMMLSLNRRSSNGLSTNLQYTLGRSRGTTGGSNEANTAANNADAKDIANFDYDNGYNNFDVRHTFNFSLLYSIPYGRGRKYGADANGFSQAVLGGWDCRRHRQRPQRRSGAGADRSSRRRLSRREWSDLRESGGRSRGDHQHARRRRVAQRAPSRT
jgi:hypothetical protein